MPSEAIAQEQVAALQQSSFAVFSKIEADKCQKFL